MPNETPLDPNSTGSIPQRHRVLVVDDTADAVFMLGKLLEVLGQQVSCARSGHEALEIARRETPRLIISDISMPEMDGYELARQLRREPALADTTLVALSGYGEESDRVRALAAGFDQQLVKPVSMENLRTLVAGLS